MVSDAGSGSGEGDGRAVDPMVVFPLARVISGGIGVGVAIGLVCAGLGVLLGTGGLGVGLASAGVGVVSGWVGVALGLVVVRAWEARASTRWGMVLMGAQGIALIGVAGASVVLYSALPSGLVSGMVVSLASAGVFVGFQVVVAREFGRAAEAARAGVG